MWGTKGLWVVRGLGWNALASHCCFNFWSWVLNQLGDDVY